MASSEHTVLVQLSDPHIGADWGPGDAVRRLAAAVRAVLALDLRPAAVLVSGDLADHADDAEYEQARELLGALEAPLCVLPGNHDTRGALRRHFDVPGRNDDPVLYARELGGLRLVVLDSTRPGEDRGELDAERLAWLDAELASVPDMPTLLAMHHPPLTTGTPAWDDAGLPPADQRALAAVIARHPQVRRLTAGHVHRTIASDLAGRALLTVPSTYVQGRLDLRARELELTDEPAGFAVHTLLDGQLNSHVQPVG
jgi:Icc protein